MDFAHVPQTKYVSQVEQHAEYASQPIEIEVIVASDGHVISAKILRSSGNNIVDRAAMKLAKSSTYKPKKQNGVPMTTKFIAVYNFKID